MRCNTVMMSLLLAMLLIPVVLAGTACEPRGTAPPPPPPPAADTTPPVTDSPPPAVEQPAPAEVQDLYVPTEPVDVAQPDMPPSLEDEVPVHLVDHEIHMPDTLVAGQRTLRIVNEGAALHSIVIEGEGVEERLDRDLASGETATMMVNLMPGEYRVYCPVGDHEERGMTTTVTVEERQQNW